MEMFSDAELCEGNLDEIVRIRELFVEQPGEVPPGLRVEVVGSVSDHRPTISDATVPRRCLCGRSGSVQPFVLRWNGLPA